MSRGIDFRQKEVIEINTGKVLGFVTDVDAEFNAGSIKNIIVAQTNGFLRSVVGKNNLTIPWNKIKLIGEDVILVDLNA